MAERGGQRRVAADQFGGGEAMALRLQDVMVVNRAELADRPVNRADEIGVCEGTRAALSGRVKKSLKVL